jgi:DNA-binding ferritin-like protein (Dps family)
MAAKWIEALTGSLEQKKQFKQYKARVEALPEPHRTAAKAFERYFMYYGGVTDGDTLVRMFGDFADLWERAAVDGTPVAAIVGMTRWSSPRHSRRPTAVRGGSTRSAPASRRPSMPPPAAMKRKRDHDH